MTTLYYIHDPMCSWCWAFAPQWKKIVHQIETGYLGAPCEIRYLLGGLAKDNNDPMPDDMRRQIQGYWRKIEKQVPGTRFNFAFWERCTPRRSTYPACRAVIAARRLNSGSAENMIESIQKAYYLEGKNPSDTDTLIQLAVALGLEKASFAGLLNAAPTQQQLDQEIAKSRQLGVFSFPNLVLESDHQTEAVPLDYNNSELVLQSIRSIQNHLS